VHKSWYQPRLSNESIIVAYQLVCGLVLVSTSANSFSAKGLMLKIKRILRARENWSSQSKAMTEREIKKKHFREARSEVPSYHSI
jgi:hypothetical protein